MFSLIIRWESNLGQVCTQHIKQYIKAKIEEEMLNGENYIEINFLHLTFTYNDEPYNLLRFSKSFPTSQIEGWVDLRGVDLHGIKLNSCCLVNCMFSLANFKGGNFQQIKLVNTNFVGANFENARLVMINADKDSTFNGINAKNAFINAMDFNDNILEDRGIIFSEISYWILLKWSFLNIFNRFNFDEERKQTIFLANSINQVSRPELTKFTSYVKWFQYVYKMVSGLEKGVRSILY